MTQSFIAKHSGNQYADISSTLYKNQVGKQMKFSDFPRTQKKKRINNDWNALGVETIKRSSHILNWLTLMGILFLSFSLPTAITIPLWPQSEKYVSLSRLNIVCFERIHDN